MRLRFVGHRPRDVAGYGQFHPGDEGEFGEPTATSLVDQGWFERVDDEHESSTQREGETA